MKALFRVLLLAAAVLAAGGLAGAERIPPAPPRYFNDYAGVVSATTAGRLNAQLEEFERASSNQLVVAIYPKRESDSSVEDYTVRVAQAWRAGQAGRNNGAVLFAFMQEHEVYLQVGYGLEPVLTDALAKRIIESEIVPRFRVGDIDGGMTAAVNAMIAASKGEYQGTGRTQAERGQSGGGGMPSGFMVMIIILIVAGSLMRRAATRPSVLLNPRRRGLRPAIWLGGGGWGGGSGGGSFGGGGGFSGGGGSFGGGGAGGKW